jgi:hypothetical protein
MLQREISNVARVHIWHPSLVKVPPGFRRVHDHRFDLTSLVLAGELIDHGYFVDDKTNDRNTKMWSIIHAKIQRAASDKPSTHPTSASDDPDVELIGDVYAERIRSETRLAGEVYRIPRGWFHESEPRALTITLVSRENFNAGQSARVLGDTAHSAIAGQHRAIERDESIVSEILFCAAKVIGVADDMASEMK